MKTTRSNIFLIVCAAIWGFAFIAQVVGMEFVGPFTFNAVRFILGGVSLLPVIFVLRKNGNDMRVKGAFMSGFICGIFLFLASSFQQIGLQGTTAGKAAFITGLYIVIVPIFGLFMGRRIKINSWIGAVTALIGLYLLCVKSGTGISHSDFLELVSAFLFAVQILLIDYFSKKVDPIKLAFYQFVVCSGFSFAVALPLETIHISSIFSAWGPILYGGVMSVGVAYTFQILGQKNADPSCASIIMSMETVFAALGGFLILGESMGAKQFLGCFLMLSGAILSQLDIFKGRNGRKTVLGS